MKAERIAEVRELSTYIREKSTRQIVHECLDEITRLQAFDETKEREKFEAWLSTHEGFSQHATCEQIARQGWLASAKARAAE